MNTHPFRLPQRVSGQIGSKSFAPQPGRSGERAADSPPAAARRIRLSELDTHFYCSVIGICLTTTELRRIVPRYATLDREHATDLQLDLAAVGLATQDGEGTKALHRALDRRYAAAIKRFSDAKDVGALSALWSEALKAGDVSPAYWAVMTHPAGTQDMRQLAFGDVHRRPRPVSAAERADVCRRMLLEDENAALKRMIERQQHRLQTLAVERDAEVRELRATIESLTAATNKRVQLADDYLYAEVMRLRTVIDERDESIAVHADRCEAAERRLKREAERAQVVRAQLAAARAAIKAMKREVYAVA